MRACPPEARRRTSPRCRALRAGRGTSPAPQRGATNYYIYITFTFHSAVDIDIELAPTPAPAVTIFGLDPPVFFGATAVVIAIAVAGVVVAVRRRKRAVR